MSPVDPEESGRDLWNRLGLGGAKLMLRYQDPEDAAAAVKYLMTHGHGHHFAVVGEGQTIVLSEMAADCLQARQRAVLADQREARGSSVGHGPELDELCGEDGKDDG